MSSEPIVGEPIVGESIVGEPMVGGDFILQNSTTISQSTMDRLGALSGVSSFASFSSFSQIASLSTEQIIKLIEQLENLISSEQSAIGRNQDSILALQSQINAPTTGYQAVYNTAKDAYSTAVRAYYSKLNEQYRTESTISSMNALLSSMMIQDAKDVSTIKWYQAQYSTLLTQITYNSEILNGQIRAYNSLSSVNGGYVQNYNNLLESYAMETNPLTLLQISSQMVGYLGNQSAIAPYMQSTLIAISTLSFYSTTYSGDISIYNASYNEYSTMESKTLADIQSLLKQKEALAVNITGYQTQLNGLRISSTNAFNTLQSQSDTFYSKKRTQVLNQLEKFKLSVDEWKAFVGFLTAQLGIQRANLDTNINLLNFQIIQIGSSDPVTKEKLQSQMSQNDADRTKINNIINGGNGINGLNSLDAAFNAILQTCLTEKADRNTFIDRRQDMTNIEIAVFQDPAKIFGIKTQYNQCSNDIENPGTGLVSKISISITKRWQDYNNLINLTVLRQIEQIRALGTVAYSRPTQIVDATLSQPFYLNPAEFQILEPLTF
jgi:hypothetical protein